MKKNTVIEILPRALWIIMALSLYLGQRVIINSPPKLTNNILLICLGIFLTIAGFLLWIYVVYYMRNALLTKELITKGAFKYSRHPMYVSIYIMLTGIGILFFSWIWFVIMLIFIPVFYWDCKIEEKQMTEFHGEKYQEYKERTGMFLPNYFKNKNLN